MHYIKNTLPTLETMTSKQIEHKSQFFNMCMCSGTMFTTICLMKLLKHVFLCVVRCGMHDLALEPIILHIRLHLCVFWITWWHVSCDGPPNWNSNPQTNSNPKNIHILLKNVSNHSISIGGFRFTCMVRPQTLWTRQVCQSIVFHCQMSKSFCLLCPQPQIVCFTKHHTHLRGNTLQKTRFGKHVGAIHCNVN